MSDAPPARPLALDGALRELRAALDDEKVLTGDATAEFVDPYEPASWGGQRNAAVVQPTSAEQVQAVVKIAGAFSVPVWVGSQGRNNGYGGSGTIATGSVIVSLRNMNWALEMNNELGCVVVEPDISYDQLYEEARASGKSVMIDTPDLGWGSLIGNAAGHGYGYTKYGDR